MGVLLGLQIAAALGFLFLVPGLPLALAFSKRVGRPWAVLAVCPLISIVATYLSLYVLNFVGLRPIFPIYGVAVVAVTVYFTVRQMKASRFSQLNDLKIVVGVIPAAALSLIIWGMSYSKFNFVGPNQDAFNHNFWIARIAQVHSVLAADSRIDSPLQSLGSGQGFYPFAWHSAVAVAASIFQVPTPVLSLATVFLLWGVALPFGLLALSREWAPESKYLGIIAGVLVQLYPLVPGVPMTWGSMTSCVGVALLPGSLFICVTAMKERTIVSTLAAMTAFVGMIFIHTPEAATLGVLIVCSSPLLLKDLKFSSLLRWSAIGLICIAPMLVLFRSYIFGDTYPLRLLFGAVNPSWENAIGTFVTMGVNVPIGLTLLSLLFPVGLVVAAKKGYASWLFIGIFGLLMVYLISGAPSGVLTHLRIFTAPWYASYERTAWVALPFVALISAVPIAVLAERFSAHKIGLRILGFALSAALMAVVVQQQFQPTVDQLTKGPEQSEVVGKADRPLFQRLKERLNDDEIVFTFGNDGSTYAFMYERILTTAGYTYNRSGKASDLLAALNRDIRDICSSPEAMQAIRQEKVGAFIFGDTLLGWGGQSWKPAEIRSLSGIKVVDVGQHLTVAVPQLDTCQ